MKNLILASFVLFNQVCSSQSDSLITYTGVNTIDGVSKDELFKRGRQWFVQTFKSANDVLQINDKEAGELSGKGIMKVPVIFTYMGKHESHYDCYFTINIWAKDNKFKYSFTNFIMKDINGGEYLNTNTKNPFKVVMVSQKKMDEFLKGAKDGVDEKIKKMIADLYDHMAKKSESDF